MEHIWLIDFICLFGLGCITQSFLSMNYNMKAKP